MPLYPKIATGKVAASADTPAAGIAEPAGFRPSPTQRKRFALAFAVAGASDVLSFFLDFVLPLQWALDLATAFLLFLILGRRWAILPGLIAEAIPGMGVFPAWVLVVFSVVLYDDIKRSKR